MSGGLSPLEIEAYHRDGILFPIAVFPPARTLQLRRSFDALEAGLGGRPEPARWTNLCFPWAHELTMEPSVLDVVESLLGPEIIVWGTIILCKHPGHGAYIGWHQDLAYSGADELPSVSAWIALSDSTSANGCMRVVAGTHRKVLAHREVPDPDNLLRAGRVLAEPVDEGQAVDIVLRAGEMSLHHDRIVHGSRPNHGDDKRIGFVIRYTTPAARGRSFPVVRARGKADCPHVTLADRPSHRGSDAALANYLRFTADMERMLAQHHEARPAT
jgi:non-haem Fe2+, alpha-ketoglutarate-dependent halogenase